MVGAPGQVRRNSPRSSRSLHQQNLPRQLLAPHDQSGEVSPRRRRKERVVQQPLRIVTLVLRQQFFERRFGGVAGIVVTGASYIEAVGDLSPYVNRNVQLAAQNLVFGAKLMRDNPYPTNLRVLKEGVGARSASRRVSIGKHRTAGSHTGNYVGWCKSHIPLVEG